MSPRPVIFISAVSSELKSARQLVANTLTFLGYEPEWQDIFGAEEGDLRAMLRRRIDASAGVVALIGQRYGAEPAEPDAQFGRVSYTQYEALYARQAGKKVWPLLLDEKFTTDPGDPEPAELRELQRAYRERVRTDIHLYQPIDDPRALELHLHKLRSDLTQLRSRSKRWLTGIAAMLLLLAGGMFMLIRAQIKQQQHDTRADAAITEMRQMLEGSINGGSEAKLQQDYEAAVRFIAMRNNLDPTQLRTLLERNAARSLADPKIPLRDKVIALREAGRFTEARDFAIQSARLLEAGRQQASREEIELWIEASKSEIALGHYAPAHAHAAKAGSLADREKDFPTWASARHQLGRALGYLRHDAEALALFQELVPLRAAQLGPEHPDTLRSRNNLACALGDHGKYAEAEQEHRAVLAVRARLLGPEDPDTLKSRNNLALALHDQGKYAEAEQEHRAVLVIRERVLGPEHQDTLWSRNNLAATLNNQGKHAEAEQKHRAVLAIQVRVLGPEHPDTLMSRKNLANALDAQGKHVEAEQEHRAVVALWEKTLGTDHPYIFYSYAGLASALKDQSKLAEALPFAQRAEEGRKRLLGVEHPEYNYAKKLREEIEAALAKGKADGR